MCNCIAHDDHNPSMSIYINGTGKYTTHCFSCGFHEDALGVVAYLENISVKKAAELLDDPLFSGGGKYQPIIEDTPPPRPERVTCAPPIGTPPPKMGWLTTPDGEPFGDPVQVWTFRNAEGNPIFYEARYMANGKKEPRCFSWGYRGQQPPKWECGHYKKPRPIYGLDQLAINKTSQVIVFEGPRKADAGQAILPMPCVGWAGGANGWRYSDWTPLAGRKIILWPDADEPGRACMANLAQHLLTLNCECIMLDPHDMPTGWDIADEPQWTKTDAMAWAKSHKTEPIKQKIDAPPPEPPPQGVKYPPEDDGEDVITTPEGIVWTEPMDVFTEIVPPKIKPEQVPECIRDWMLDMEGVKGVDRTILALGAIVSSASLLHDDIKLQPEINNHTWTESARLWGAIVGDASVGKTPALGAALATVKKIDDELSDEEGKIRYEHSLKEKAFKKIEADYIKQLENGETPPPIQHPELPEIPRLILQNTTIEGVEEVAKHCSRGLLVDRDELSEWFGSMDAYKSGRGGSDQAAWLQFYNGGSRRVDRVGRGSFKIKNWSGCLIGGIQPGPMREICSGIREDGLLQRFMVIMGRQSINGNEQRPNEVAYKRYHDMQRQIFQTIPSGDRIYLSEGANEIRKEIADKAAQLINIQFISPSFCSHLGKWSGLSGRLMLTYHAIECADRSIHPQSLPISEQTAIKVKHFMCDFLLTHAIAFYMDVLGASELGRNLKAIAAMILSRKGMQQITQRDMHRGWVGWRHVSDSQRETILTRLVEAGWIQPHLLSRVNHRRYPTRWLVNPTLWTVYAAKAAEEIANRKIAAEHIAHARDLSRHAG